MHISLVNLFGVVLLQKTNKTADFMDKLKYT